MVASAAKVLPAVLGSILFSGTIGTPTIDYDRVTIPITGGAAANMAGGTGECFEFWIRAAASNTNTGSVWVDGNIIIDRDSTNGGAQGGQYGFSILGGLLCWGLAPSNDILDNYTNVLTTTVVNDDQWHHIVAQRRISDGAYWLYVDGSLEANGVLDPGEYLAWTSGGDAKAQLIEIGGEKNDFEVTSLSYEGYFTELRLSNFLRYTAGAATIPVPTSPLDGSGAGVAYYGFTEGAGSTIADTGGGQQSDATVVFGGSPTVPAWSNESPYKTPVASATLTNTQASPSNDRVELFGQGFARGDVPSGATLAATIDGVAAPIQVSRQSTWPDGSLRYAACAVVSGDFSASQTKALSITTGGSALGGSDITLADLPADGVENADLTLGAETITCNRTALQAAGGELQQIFAGPHCAQWVWRPSYTNVPRVRAAFHITAFRQANTGAVDSVEWSGGNECVDIRRTQGDHGTVASGLHRLRVNGATVYSETAVMYQYTRWHRWQALPDVHVIHDHAYLDTTGLIPPVRSTFSVPAAALAAYQSDYNSNDGINQTRGWRDDMSAGGADEGDIGPTPSWDQVYRIEAGGSDGADWREQLWLRTEGGGRHQVHYFDEVEGRPVQVGPGAGQHAQSGLNPDLGLNSYYGSYPTPSWTTEGTDVAHQPRFGYTQYLLFGRYFFLEEQQYWAAMCCGNGDGGYQSASQYNLWCWEQTRAEAWGTLSVACAAVLAPDNDAMRAYFEAAMARNIAEAWDNNYAPGQPGHSVCGCVVQEYPPERSTLLGQDNFIVSWQSDFVNIANCWAWMMGYDGTDPALPDYTDYSEWTARWPVGRVHKFGAQNAALYWLDVGSGANSPPASWANLRNDLYEFNTNVGEAFRGDSGSNEYNTGRNNALARTEEPDTAAWRAAFSSLSAGESVGDSFEPGADQAVTVASLAFSVMRGADGAADAWNKFNALNLCVNNGSTENPPYSGRTIAQPQYDLRTVSEFPHKVEPLDPWIVANIGVGSTWQNITPNIGNNLAIHPIQAAAYSGGAAGGGFAFVFGGGHNNGMNDGTALLNWRKFSTEGFVENPLSTADFIEVADTNYASIGSYQNGLYSESIAIGGVRDERGFVPVSRHTYDSIDMDDDGSIYMFGGNLSYDNAGQPSPPWNTTGTEDDFWRYRQGIGWDQPGDDNPGVGIPTSGMCFDRVDGGRVWTCGQEGLRTIDIATGVFSSSIRSRFDINFGDESWLCFGEDDGAEGRLYSGGSFGGTQFAIYDIATDTVLSSNNPIPGNYVNTYVWYIPASRGANYGTLFAYAANQGTLYRWNGSSWVSIATGGPTPNDFVYGRANFDEVHQIFYVIVPDGSSWAIWAVRPYAFEA